MTIRDDNHEYALAIIESKNSEIRRLRAELALAELTRDTLRAELTQAKLLKGRAVTDVLFPGAA